MITVAAGKPLSPGWVRELYAERRIMLVLSRKKNESIVVDDAIIITVVEIRGDKVRLGIEAPREVPIHRSEVYAAIHQASASTTPQDAPSDASVPQS